MKKWIKNNASRSLLMFVVAIALIAGASIRSAWSYFTTYATAKGGYIIHLGDETEITEEYSDWTKKIQIKSEADSEPVYVRAKGFCSEYDLVYSGSDKWSPGEGGWYYYSDIVKGGEVTDVLEVQIKDVPKGTDTEEGDNFNVIVVYESTPVLYDSDGNPYADWTKTVDTGE